MERGVQCPPNSIYYPFPNDLQYLKTNRGTFCFLFLYLTRILPLNLTSWLSFQLWHSCHYWSQTDISIYSTLSWRVLSLLHLNYHNIMCSFQVVTRKQLKLYKRSAQLEQFCIPPTTVITQNHQRQVKTFHSAIQKTQRLHKQ